MKIGRAAWLTDTGRRRMRNEDAYVFEPPLFAIADGMGGARAGEVAAGLAAGALREGRRDVVGEESLEASIAEANRRVWERSLADPSTAGMGTTVTVALVDAAGRRGRLRARRRLARLPPAGRPARADHHRPLARRRARRERGDHARGGREAPATLRDHPRRGHRERDRDRRLHRDRRARGSRPALLRRSHGHALGEGDRVRPARRRAGSVEGGRSSSSRPRTHGAARTTSPSCCSSSSRASRSRSPTKTR